MNLNCKRRRTEGDPLPTVVGGNAATSECHPWICGAEFHPWLQDRCSEYFPIRSDPLAICCRSFVVQWRRRKLWAMQQTIEERIVYVHKRTPFRGYPAEEFRYLLDLYQTFFPWRPLRSLPGWGEELILLEARMPPGTNMML